MLQNQTKMEQRPDIPETPSEEIQLLTSAFATSIVNDELDKVFTPAMRAQLYLAVEKHFNTATHGVDPELCFDLVIAKNSRKEKDIEINVSMTDNATVLVDIQGGKDDVDLRAYLSCDTSYHVCNIKAAAIDTSLIETTTTAASGFRSYESADGMSGFGFRVPGRKKH